MIRGQWVRLSYVDSADELDIMNRYYEGGVSSVYFWDLDDGFAGVVLLKKSMYHVGLVPE
jgi:capping protein beta